MNKKNIGEIFKLSLITALLLFIFLFSTLFYWSSDGFSIIEVGFASILGGAYYFIIFLITAIWGLNAYVRNCISEDVKPFGKFPQVLILLFASFILFIVVDSLFFYIIDDSVSSAFADALVKMAEENNQSLEGIEDFRKLPFSFQNGIVIFVSGLLAALFSMIFIKKDGKLFNKS